MSVIEENDIVKTFLILFTTFLFVFNITQFVYIIGNFYKKHNIPTFMFRYLD